MHQQIRSKTFPFPRKWATIRKEENNNRTVKTIGENSKTKKMTRKVDTWEYESLAECIKMDQVPATELAEIFTDKAFYKYYKKNWLDKSGKK